MSTFPDILKQLHIDNKDDYADAAFSRNLGLIDYAGQRRLLRSRIAIPGLGGVGGVHIATLARTGIGAFTIADFDVYSPVNINRQYGSGVASFNRPKLDVMRDRALDINPFLDIRAFEHGVTPENIDEFLDGVSVLVDSLDYFVQKIRRRLFNRALELNIPVITAAPAGCSCSILVFMPGGMNYDQYFGVNDQTDETEQIIRFSLGVAPKPTHLAYMDRRFANLYDKRVPSLDIGCQLCAGMTATEVVNIVLKGKPSVAVPRSMQFDAKRGLFRTTRFFRGVDTPWQRTKIKLAKRFFLLPATNSPAANTKPDLVFEQSPIPEDALRFIIRAAIQAPSGDNVQPWKFALKTDGLQFSINREADPSFFNVQQVASLLATGAALQNMEYAAGSLGLQCTAKLFPAGEGKDQVADLTFQATGVPFHEIMERTLWRRCTNRRMYSRQSVPTEVWERLGQLIGQEEGMLLAHANNRQDLKNMAKAVYLADRVRVERKDLHEYLMQIIHFDPLPKDLDPASPPHFLRNGMPLKNLEAGLPGELYLRLIRPWKVMNVANKIGIGRMMPIYGGLGVLQSGGTGLLCLPASAVLPAFSETTILQAGQAMQRLWCALEHYGYALQPMAALPLLYLHMRIEPDVFTRQHVQLLQQAWALAAQTLAIPEGYLPIFMFRTGKSGAIRQRTYRYTVEDLLTPSDEVKQ